MTCTIKANKKLHIGLSNSFFFIFQLVVFSDIAALNMEIRQYLNST